MGKFYYLFAAHLPAIIGSYLSILLERKSRRSALSFYVANIASETVWNKIVSKGWLKPLPAGESILFALSTASFLYLIHTQGRYGKDPVSFVFKFLLGSDFLQQVQPSSTSSSQSITSQCEQFTQDNAESNDLLILQHSAEPQATSQHNADHQFQHVTQSRDRHDHHHHHHHLTTDTGETVTSYTHLVANLLSSPSIHTDSCMLSVLHAFLRAGLIAYVGNSLVTLAMKPDKMATKPIESIVNALVYNDKSRRLALFASCFTGLFKASNCINFWLEMRPTNNHHCHVTASSSSSSSCSQVNAAPVKTFVNALLASSSMLLYRSPKMAQYMLWKAIETSYFQSVKSGSVKYVDFTLNMLYAVSTAHLFYVAVMEPKLIPKSYTHWLNKVTRGSFSLLNRNIINVFGTDSTFGYPSYHPEIDILQPQFVSDKFKESVLVWML